MPKRTTRSKTAEPKTVKSKAIKKKSTLSKTTKKKVTRAQTASTRKPKKTSAVVYSKTSEYLTSKEVAYYKGLLVEKMNEIIGDVDSIENEALKKSRLDATGDLSSMPIHMADIGTDNYEQEFALNLVDSERKILHEVVEALQRIEDEVYGICEITGRAIAKARLEAKPWARYCISYARLVEKGVLVEGDPLPEGFELDRAG